MAKPGNKMINVHYIKALQDESLYSQAMVIRHARENGLFAPGDEIQKARSRLSYFVKTRDFPKQPDGYVLDEAGMRQPAWYGARWKSQVPPSYLAEGERGQLMEKLAKLTGVAPSGGGPMAAPVAPKEEVEPFSQAASTAARLAAVERRMAAIAGEPSLSSSRRAAAVASRPRWRRLGAALAIAIAALGAVYAWQWRQRQAWPAADGLKPAAIAVLPCMDRGYGLLTAQAVESALKNVASLQFISYDRVERSTHLFNPCDGPDKAQLRALAEDIGASLLLWGFVEREGERNVYRGALFHVDFGIRTVTLSTDRPMQWAELAADWCLSALALEDRPLPAASFYSANEAANLVYSEAEYFYQKGQIAASMLLYERAGLVYDPSFYAARAKLGRALFFNGQNPRAIETLETLLDEAEESMPYDLTVFVCKHLAALYYENADFDRLETALARARGLARPDDGAARIFILKMEAKLAAALGQDERADIVSRDMLALAEQLGSPEMAEAARARARLYFQRNDYPAAIRALDAGIAQAREQGLLAEEAEMLAQKAEVLFKAGPRQAVESIVLDLIETRAAVEQVGRAVDAVRLEYWLGRAYAYLGETESALSYLTTAAAAAEALGVADLEVGAKIALADAHIEGDRWVDALRLLDPLERRVDEFPPKYGLWVYDRLRWVHFEQGDVDRTLSALENHGRMARRIGDPSLIARSLNSKGYVLYTVGRYPEAEEALRRAIELYPADDATKAIILKNLVRLYEALGQDGEANRYNDQLAKLDAVQSQ